MNDHKDDVQVVGPFFLEGPDCQWEIMLAMDRKQGQVHPAGIRDAITHRQPNKYPNPEQVKEALAMAHWAQNNDPDYPNGPEGGRMGPEMMN